MPCYRYGVVTSNEPLLPLTMTFEYLSFSILLPKIYKCNLHKKNYMNKVTGKTLIKWNIEVKVKAEN